MHVWSMYISYYTPRKTISYSIEDNKLSIKLYNSMIHV